MVTEKEKAVERLQRLLNADFDRKEFKIVITYENSVKKGMKEFPDRYFDLVGS